MAIFGAPTAHEDDPERAVRAAPAIRDFAQDEGIELRMGITTGEALVSLEARPEKAEAGILETDSAEQAEEKLSLAARDPWVEAHLRPLVGLAAAS
jgi:pyruvate/2-oxoglutarate dehydrogenase complex dihydrolipoamide acyltransferase (E2) component